MNIKVINVFALDNQGGNPCAIVDNAAKLSTEEMQTIATHLNLPETIYIIPNKNQYLLRFFATKGELPLCCHGVLGAAFYLLKLHQKKPLHIETCNTNKIDVGYDSNLVYMSLINSGKILDAKVDTPTISDMLQISKSAIPQNLPCVVASVGSPKLFIPIINRKLLFNIEPNLDFIAKWSKGNIINGIYVYSKDTKDLTLVMWHVVLIHCLAIKKILLPA